MLWNINATYLIDFTHLSFPPKLKSQAPSEPPWIQAESFPLHVYTMSMYPPHVTDHDIKLLISELTVGDRPPSGARLRAALHKRFGSRGGVSRIYRLLTDTGAGAKNSAPQSIARHDVGKLHHELESLREALKLADYREQTHQSRWAMEVDRLRQQIASIEPLALKAKAALDTAELLRHQLHASHVRIAALEQQLLDVQARGG